MFYTVIKALHIIGVVAWFAGLFYIFRLFVYHTENKQNQDICRVLETMERRLYKAIMMPAMIFTTLMGSTMLYLRPGLFIFGWLHIKFGCLILLFAYHFYSNHTRKRFLNKDFFLSSKQCRFLNEVPTLVLIAVVLLAVLKPF